MKPAIKLVLTACVVAALSWSPALAVQAPAVARTTGNGSVFGSLYSVSCPSAGNCAAAGTNGPNPGNQAMVINQTHGIWGRAQQVAGLSSLPSGPVYSSRLLALSCSSAGNCAAGGSYLGAKGLNILVVNQQNGVWGNAQAIDTSHLKPALDGQSELSFLSCRAAGDCTATGWYYTKSSPSLFVLDEQNGTWGEAQNLPGTGSPTFTGAVESLACVSPGNCAVGGHYSGLPQEAFVATETNGAWSRLHEVPGTGVLNARLASTNSVSCTSGGNCVAVGYYEGLRSGKYEEHPFITRWAHGSWGPIKTVPGLATLPTGGAASASLDLVWCGSAANCIAVGDYVDADNVAHWFSVSERNGAWAKAVKIRTGARSPVFVTSLSCTSTADCSAGGYFEFTYFDQRAAFVINRKNGAWGEAEQVPGLNKINKGRFAELFSVSCGAAGSCAAGGFTTPSRGHYYPFVTNETGGTWGSAVIPGLP